MEHIWERVVHIVRIHRSLESFGAQDAIPRRRYVSLPPGEAWGATSRHTCRSQCIQQWSICTSKLCQATEDNARNGGSYRWWLALNLEPWRAQKGSLRMLLGLFFEGHFLVCGGTISNSDEHEMGDMEQIDAYFWWFDIQRHHWKQWWHKIR